MDQLWLPRGSIFGPAGGVGGGRYLITPDILEDFQYYLHARHSGGARRMKNRLKWHPGVAKVDLLIIFIHFVPCRKIIVF